MNLVRSILQAIQRVWRLPPVRRGVGLSALAFVGLGMGVTVGSWTRACAGGNCPSIAEFEEFRPSQALKIYAADGRLITELGTERRTVLALSDLPPTIPAAFLAVEDKRFYEHNGIDYLRFFGALKAVVMAFDWVQGFSTITMQLARNVFPEKLPSTKTLQRKLREVQVALELERTYSKDKILELYLNQVYLGGSAYGVEAGAHRYFGKSALELNVAEVAMLAAVVNRPARYDPRRHPDRALPRRNLVINLMRDEGYITPDEAESWKAYPVILSSRQDFGDVAPYFVEWVRQQVYARFGRAIYERGYRVYTTLDLDMQIAAERALGNQLEAIENEVYGPYEHVTYAAYSDTVTVSRSLSVTPYLQGSLVAVEASTGYVRAMVGGRDFSHSKFNRATQAERQAGSTFKPFVYSAAIRAGIPLSYIIDDAPITRTLPGDSMPWEPQNYEGDFRGPMTLRDGIRLSRNLVAIRLGEELGVQPVRGEALRFGLSTRIPSYPSMFIGAASVIPIEMVSAYTAFANGGVRSAPVGVRRVEDEEGNIVWEPQIRRDRVMEPPHAWLMTSLLQDVVNRGTASTAVRNIGRFTLPAGGKTGTTNDGTDVWFIGFTPELVASVWIGLDRPQRIKARSAGGRLAAPAWVAFMKEVYERRPAPDPWERPDGLINVAIDNVTGYRWTAFCPIQVRQFEWFLPGTEPTEFCPVHNPLISRGPLPPGTFCGEFPTHPQSMNSGNTGNCAGSSSNS